MKYRAPYGANNKIIMMILSDDLWTKVFQLWRPSIWDILKRVWGVNCEAEENHMSVRIRQRPQPGNIKNSESVFCGNLYAGMIFIKKQRRITWVSGYDNDSEHICYCLVVVNDDD